MGLRNYASKIGLASGLAAGLAISGPVWHWQLDRANAEYEKYEGNRIPRNISGGSRALSRQCGGDVGKLLTYGGCMLILGFLGYCIGSTMKEDKEE